MAHFFISFAHEDEALAQEVNARLKRLKQSGFISTDGIAPGEEYRSRLDDSLRAAHAVIVILTDNATKSKWVDYEWAFALGAKIAIIPVIMRKINLAELHPRLEALHHLDLTTKDETNWTKFATAVLHASQAAESKVSPLPSQVNRPVRRTVPVEQEEPRPQMYAKFELKNNKPFKVEDSYSISIELKNVPPETRRVYYKILDKTFTDAEFEVGSDRSGFEESITSYGDVPITASDKRKRGSWRIRTTLVDALRRHYGLNPPLPIQRAIADIAAN